MKSVSWSVAFRSLNEWRERGSIIAFGIVESVEGQGETTTMFSGLSTSRIRSVDEDTGTVTLDGGESLNLVGASFELGEGDDSPLDEADLTSCEYRFTLEATFPDGSIWILAEEWGVK